MKNLFRLSVVFVAILLAGAGLASAGARGSSSTEGAALADIFAAPCPQATGITGITALAGPADGCCTRHADICDSVCACGILSFTCGENSTGGCSSACRCNKCV